MSFVELDVCKGSHLFDSSKSYSTVNTGKISLALSLFPGFFSDILPLFGQGKNSVKS